MWIKLQIKLSESSSKRTHQLDSTSRNWTVKKQIINEVKIYKTWWAEETSNWVFESMYLCEWVCTEEIFDHKKKKLLFS